MNIQKILVVCIGNICRSPMAECLLKQQYPLHSIHSAGLQALVGAPADDKAQLCMQHLGLNLDMHIAKKITTQMLKDADLVLVMSQNQQQHIEQMWPFSKGKVFRLGHWKQRDVADPYQQDQAAFDQTCQLIQDCILDWKLYI